MVGLTHHFFDVCPLIFTPKGRSAKRFRQERRPTCVELVTMYKADLAKLKELMTQLDRSWIEELVFFSALDVYKHISESLVQLESGELLIEDVSNQVAREEAQNLTKLKQSLRGRTKCRSCISVDGGIEELELLLELHHGKIFPPLVFQIATLVENADVPSIIKVKNRLAWFTKATDVEIACLETIRKETSDAVVDLEEELPQLRKLLFLAAQASPEENALQRAAIDVLNDLMTTHGNDFASQANNPWTPRVDVFVEATRFVLASMRTHRGDHRLQTNCCAALATLAVMSADMCVQAAAVEELVQVVVEAHENTHGWRQELVQVVVAAACSSLQKLAKCSIDAQAIVACIASAKNVETLLGSYGAESGTRLSPSGEIRQLIVGTRWLRLAEACHALDDGGESMKRTSGPSLVRGVDSDSDCSTFRLETGDVAALCCEHRICNCYDLQVTVLATSGMHCPAYRLGHATLVALGGMEALFEGLYVQGRVMKQRARTSKAIETQWSAENETCEARFTEEVMNFRCDGDDIKIVLRLRVARNSIHGLVGGPKVGQAALRLSRFDLSQLIEPKSMTIPVDRRGGDCSGFLHVRLQATPACSCPRADMPSELA
eukprot:TRINITY_DN8336_c0_g1_i2.p1 TRINITY_DN8336_c0_g1~~TRINITY_DN8336_c0_g1_i2.p1  ORF type:complete len:607 (-),score=104.47 TRINITY_DN8336_c0_g1_i2:152-1972(-)